MDLIFQDILDITPFDALVKYAPLYVGVNPNQLASIEQGKAFIQNYLQNLAVLKTGTHINDPALVGIPAVSGGIQVDDIPAEQLLADGLPSKKRINLHMVFKGPKAETDEYEGDDSRINVALAIQMYFGTKTTAANPDGLWENITKRPSKPVNPVVIKPPVAPPPDFDPPPVHGHNDDGTAKKKKK